MSCYRGCFCGEYTNIIAVKCNNLPFEGQDNEKTTLLADDDAMRIKKLNKLTSSTKRWNVYSKDIG